jgi:hypothetical protein
MLEDTITDGSTAIASDCQFVRSQNSTQSPVSHDMVEELGHLDHPVSPAADAQRLSGVLAGPPFPDVVDGARSRHRCAIG